MNSSLLPWTKLLLAVSGLTQFVFGLVMILATGLVNSFFWPLPFEPVPDLSLRYLGVLYLTMALGAAYALAKNDWRTARTYLVIAGPYVALCLVLALLAAITPPGVPLIMWLYVVLSILYLPQVVWVWRRQSTVASQG